MCTKKPCFFSLCLVACAFQAIACLAPAEILKPAQSPPNDDQLTLEQSAPIGEGATKVAGQIGHIPADQTIHLQFWTRPEGQTTPPVTQMTLIGAGGSPSTVQQVDVTAKNPGYSIQFPAPLAAGQIITVVAVTDDGTRKTLLEKLLPSAIAIGSMTLTVEEPILANAKAVSGTLSYMPQPAVAPSSAQGTTPATYGNYPGIVIWLRDAVTGKWSQAAPAIGTSAAQFFSVNSDGSFQVALPAVLQNGQEIRVDVVPPPGRSFTSGGEAVPPQLPPPATVVSDLSKTFKVLSAAALSQPTISTSPFFEGTTVLTGTATIPSSGAPAGIVVLRLKSQVKGIRERRISIDEDQPTEAFHHCLRINELSSQEIASLGTLLPLTTSSSNTLVGAVDATAGTYKITLAEALKEGDWIQIIQVLPAGAATSQYQEENCASLPVVVTYPFHFYRTNLSFVAGVLLSNSSADTTTNANFSQANQFYAFNADHSWRLPGYNCVDHWKWGIERKVVSGHGEERTGNCRLKHMTSQPNGNDSRADGWSSSHFPGINSFFEGRLSAIPVSTATNLTPSGNNAGSSTQTQTGASTTLLTSQKIFRAATGVYLPWVVVHGWGPHPQGLFLGPIAKAGFDTVTGAASASTVVLADGSTGTLNFQTAYKFYSYGFRLGNMSLSQSPERAPLLEHFLDLTIGRYSNLQSYVCHPANASAAKPGKEPAGSSCDADYPKLFADRFAVDSRKQLYRIDLEGLVRIPVPQTAIPFYIGVNANISQHTWQAEQLDHAFAPPDDIRILFGTKIDIGSLLSGLKLGAN